MALRIEDYAVIGDTHTAALVGSDGSIDWLCLPRFDSGACFAALLGDESNGSWRLRPEGAHRTVARRYRDDTLVLETEFATDDGVVRVVDSMPVRDRYADVIRLVEGVRGTVRMRSDLRLRFDYGSVVPWVRGESGRVVAAAGPDTVVLDADVDLSISGADIAASFAVSAGDRVAFTMTWVPPGERPPARRDAVKTVASTERWWRSWASSCSYHGRYRDAVVRSLITLKAMTYAPSGGIVAAVTTSLPEQLGGVRNWDYRYCWLRDATFTLLSLLDGGYKAEAAAWREWLLRALAGDPKQMQIMYGVNGERRLTEIELDWLAGYEGSRPVRLGNAAHAQFQLDVYGELMDALHQARANGLPPDPVSWDVQVQLMDFLESHWRDPDNGMWEVRGQRRHFVHSKVMAWAAADRAVKAVEWFGRQGPADRWRALRQEIFEEVCEKGFDTDRNTFTQYYGSRELDAALLLMAPVGFLPARDPRVRGTVEAIEKELLVDGFVRRYTMTDQVPGQSHPVDGLPPGEGAFLACTFWLADNYALQGRTDEARAVFERLLALRNDVGLLSEEYDSKTGRLVGNFPQAFSHVPLVNTALSIDHPEGPTPRRSRAGQTESEARRAQREA